MAKKLTCQLPAAGVKAGFGSMQNTPTLCPNVDKLFDGVGDFEGPVGTVNFIVPVQSSQNAISAEAAYFVFGFGDQGKAEPWVDNNLIVRRNDTSAVQLYVALAAGVPASRFKGVDAMNNANSIKFVADATNKEAAIGFVSGENADANRASVRTLAYQHKGQKCGYWPDSTASAFDKANVRSGQYHPWGAAQPAAPAPTDHDARAQAAAVAGAADRAELDRRLTALEAAAAKPAPAPKEPAAAAEDPLQGFRISAFLQAQYESNRLSEDQL